VRVGVDVDEREVGDVDDGVAGPVVDEVAAFATVVDVTCVVAVGAGTRAAVVTGGVFATPGLGADPGRTRMKVTRAATKMSAVTAVERRARPRVTSTVPRCRCRGLR